MTQNRISRNFAMVSEGTRRGNGDKKGLNIPETCGNMTLSVALDFLYRQKESMERRKAKGMLLTVLQGVSGEVDPMKKRLINYGLFGKNAQTSAKKFSDHQIEKMFVWGQNMSSYETRKIDEAIVALCKAHGDESATRKNFKSSPAFDQAMETAKNMQFLVTGRYDDGFVGVNDDDDTQGFINLGYVKLGTGKFPMVSAFDRPPKDGLVEIEWNGETAKDYPLNLEGTVSLTASRSYLKNFCDDGTHGWQNLKMLKSSNGGDFWVVNVGSYNIADLPADFFASFSEETRAVLATAKKISFEYGLKDTDGKVIDDILRVNDGVPDAVLAFTGLIEDDMDNGRWRVYKRDDGDVFITVRLIRGTFYTQRVMG